MRRLLMVSNRLPVSISKHTGGIHFIRSAGGLATGLVSLAGNYEQLWIGWPGITSDKLEGKDKNEITRKLADESCRPVFISQKQAKNYYQGFSNKTIWPLFHYFPLRTIYENSFWAGYKEVNKIFCDEVVKYAEPGDCIWVHDYQLMLLPQMLRESLPEAEIGFFLHIPFPSFELFRFLPWREELLSGLLGADLVGFHTYDYVRHFLSSVSRIMGFEHTLGKVGIDNRIVKVDAFPMGIDYEKYSQAPSESGVQREINKIRQKIGDRKIIISVDRLDYTKGIKQRLEAFDLFLSQNPQYKGKVTLIMVAVPSRTGVKDYMLLRNELEQLVGRIGGEHGMFGWMPVWYLYRHVPFERLIALYHIADVALVTPLRDGMNLIAKEFIATKTKGKGVLILSEMAGAASELGEAVTVNANNKAAIIKAIKEALEMSVEEQQERNRAMQSRLARYTVSRWADDFLNALADIRKTQLELLVRKLTESTRQKLISEYSKGKKRLLFLDYDGTLVGFKGRPEQAGPDGQVLNLLGCLCKKRRNEVVIISGRDKTTLEKWLGALDAVLIAEHGGWIRERAKKWQHLEPLHEDWKETVRPILELYADRTPRSLVEEKDFSLVWHYRKSDAELAYIRTQELKDHLLNLTANLDVGVFEGSKILEIRCLGVNKGRVAKLWLEREKWDFILTAGDDYTDEEMFTVMPESAYSIKVGRGISRAKFNVNSVYDMRLLLSELSGT